MRILQIGGPNIRILKTELLLSSNKSTSIEDTSIENISNKNTSNKST